MDVRRENTDVRWVGFHPPPVKVFIVDFATYWKSLMGKLRKYVNYSRKKFYSTGPG